jgi:hypothetical protein
LSITAFVTRASRNAFYDLIACALETHNPRMALQRVAEAREYLPQIELNLLVCELEADYYEFT